MFQLNLKDAQNKRKKSYNFLNPLLRIFLLVLERKGGGEREKK